MIPKLTPTNTPVLGLQGDYYDNIDFISFVKSDKYDGPINYDWASGAPNGEMGADTFSIRRTGGQEDKTQEPHYRRQDRRSARCT